MQPNRSRTHFAQDVRPQTRGNVRRAPTYERRVAMPPSPVRQQMVDGIVPPPSHYQASQYSDSTQEDYISSLTNEADINQGNWQIPALGDRQKQLIVDMKQFFIGFIRNLNLKQVRAYLPAMAILLLLVGSLVGLANWRNSDHATARGKVLGLESEDDGINGDTPTEKKPTEIGKYSVAEGVPRFLTINKIDVDARVKRIGVKNDSKLKSPTNIFDVAWYDGSAKPGEMGTTLITGHIMGAKKNGVFYDLKDLVPGDTIDLESGGGKKIRYYVVKMAAFKDGEMSLQDLTQSISPGKHGLTLVTTIANYPKAQEYNEHLVVYALQDSVLDELEAEAEQAKQPVNN